MVSVPRTALFIFLSPIPETLRQAAILLAETHILKKSFHIKEEYSLPEMSHTRSPKSRQKVAKGWLKGDNRQGMLLRFSKNLPLQNEIKS